MTTVRPRRSRGDASGRPSHQTAVKLFRTRCLLRRRCGSGGGFASIAVDTSTGASRDRLYLICTNRERNTVFVHNSSDRGERWSAPVRADSASGEAIFRRTPSIAVNKDGVVAVTWYERRKEGDA